MPFGTFLDSFPAAIFVGAHLLFLALGVWAVRRAGAAKHGEVFWLYALSQVFFLVFFGGALTMKMAVLVEQMLIAAMVFMVVRRA
jgi:low temperature requirement protein LtrA